MTSSERRLVWSLLAVTFLLWIGASAIVPLLPTYLHRNGTSSGLVGIVMASYFAFAVVTQYPVGRVCDRVGSRAVIVGGLVVFVAGSVGFAAQDSTLPAILYRSTQGIGSGAVGVASAALIAHRVDPTRHGRGYALLYGSQSLALAIGPVFGGLVGASSMRLVFLGAATLAALAIVPVATSALMTSPRATPPSEVHLGALTAKSDALSFRCALIGALAVFASIGLLTGLYESCWSLLLSSRHATGLAIGLSWTLFCLPFALLSGPAGNLADRWNRKVLVAAGIATSALFAVIYPELKSVVLLVSLGCVEAAGAVVVTPAALSMLTQWTPENRHGATQGVLGTVRTGFTAVAAAGAGALFGEARALPFMVMAILMAACAMTAIRAWRRLPARAPGSVGVELITPT
jgi:DHA1 family multidrug resistance protein-like MFS transporter